MIQIHNLENNPLAIVPLGKAKTKLGHIRILHPIDIIQFKYLISGLNNQIGQENIDHPLYKLIQEKNAHLYETYIKINPVITRHKRWDSIGTLWKWIAGTPDAEDLRIINATMNTLITENNNQVLINRAIDKRIQQITNITNEIILVKQNILEQHKTEMNLLVLLSNLNTLQHQLEIIEDAILLAKHGIPSSRLLSIKDFQRITTFLEQHNIHVSSFENLLSQSAAQVSINQTHIMYILKIPQLSKETYEYKYIDSIIQDQKRILIAHNYILMNQSHVYATMHKCNEELDKFLCEEDIITTTNECVYNLMQIRNSNCTYEKVYSPGIIKRLNDATILLNDVKLQMHSNCSNNTQHLEGSYLIQFENCEIQLNDEYYTNFVMEIKPYQPTTGLIAHQNHIIDVPSPEFLNNLTLTHRNQLNHVYLYNESLQWKLHLFGSIGLTSILIIIAAVIILYFLWRTKTDIAINIAPETKNADNEEIELAETSKTINKSPYPDMSDERYKETINYLNMATPERSSKL